MTDTLLTIAASVIDWSRAQFAITAIYHWLFVPLTLGLALIMGIMETCYYRTKKSFWRDAARFWQKMFGINFAMGVATGLILEFEFGTNWSNYSWFVGDIFGAPLAVEGIIAFFMESTFVAVMFFGWNKVSRGFHLASTWLTGLGATISAWWILVANSWMQYPVGCEFNPDTVRNEMVSFAEVALSPYAVDKFMHTVISSWIIGAAFVVAVSAWYLLKKREKERAVQSIKIGAAVGLVASVLTAVTGDGSAYRVAQVQPMKLAAMEALYNGGKNVDLTLVAMVNPFSQPDYANEQEPPMKIGIPNGLSFLATRTADGYVPGVNDLMKGYTKADGTVELSYAEKIEKGKVAIQALAEYTRVKKEAKGAPTAGQKAQMESLKLKLKDNMKYFGYGYIKNVDELVPFIPVNFWAFRIMVGLGMWFILIFAVVLFVVYRKDMSGMKWLQWAAIVTLPLAYIASESGWLVAEFGRQPWTIQDMLPLSASISDVKSGSVATTFFIFLFLFTAMLAVELNIMRKEIKKGPEHSVEGESF
ncbi:MAG: cytochrome ubiquinol oxidase subunit I [Prevotella sp.]|nr:cytochrome ubiquinol oxidase subunit I [Prevotella sp.]